MYKVWAALEIPTRDSDTRVSGGARAGNSLWASAVACGHWQRNAAPGPPSIRSDKQVASPSALLMAPSKSQTQPETETKGNLVIQSAEFSFPEHRARRKAGLGGQWGVPSTHPTENLAGLEAMGEVHPEPHGRIPETGYWKRGQMKIKMRNTIQYHL